MVQQFIAPLTRRPPRSGDAALRHARFACCGESRAGSTHSLDELVMMRAKSKGDLYVHQGERSERERAAIGKASRDACDRPATCPEEVSTTRTSGGANYNVIALILDTPSGWRFAPTDCREAPGGLCPQRRVKDSVVERPVYTPYGEITVNQMTSYGDRDGDGDVDSTDKGTPGTTCTGTVSGACRILDLVLDSPLPALRADRKAIMGFAHRGVSRIDGDYDSTDASAFDSLPQGLAHHPGRFATSVDQPFGHQGLLYEPEVGSYQNRARQYLPMRKRFAQRDPLGSFGGGSQSFYESAAEQAAARYAESTGVFLERAMLQYVRGMSTYEYLDSSPADTLDPSGLIPCVDCKRPMCSSAGSCDNKAVGAPCGNGKSCAKISCCLVPPGACCGCQ